MNRARGAGLAAGSVRFYREENGRFIPNPQKNSLTQSQQSQQSFLVPFPQIAHSTSAEGR
jgi:hypothetical protein